MKNPQFDNVRVGIRVRPPLPRETEEGVPFRSIAIVSPDHKSISLAEYLGAELDEIARQREWVEKPQLFQLHRFTFDSVFDLDSTQIDVYNITAKQAVNSVLEGYNSTIFCYGQTGTGKTYTMEGFTYSAQNEQRGIIQRTIEDIFTYIEHTSNQDTKFIIRASYLQIYNESISDLLKPEKKNLQIREDKKKGIYVDLLSEWAVRTPVDLYALLKRGASYRTTAATLMNDVSSRSHAVFVITVEQMKTENIKGQTHTQIKVGKLNLVDLAGSERIRVTGATGQQLEESKKINKSLSCLGNVINALTEQKGKIHHVPYRDSKLTRLLEDSLGGNCKTTMLAMISPAHESFSESLSTLHFAQRAKKIKNRPVINEDLNNRALIRQYETELRNLRNELEQKNKMLQSNELVMQLQEEKEQALQDKNEAIRELEKASRQYLLEREEKLNLEKKIQMMNSQMITGGHKIEETPQFKSALKNQLLKYESKIQEIEKEKEKMFEDIHENEQYKDILNKQKDIMIALSNKLNERDELIANLEEQIDIYDNQDNNFNNISKRINQLEGLLIKNKIPLPENINKGNLNKNDINNKNYLPYEAETNIKQFDNQPLIMLSPNEKINELRGIISEQENKINYHDVMLKKLMNTVNPDGMVDLNKLLQQMETAKDLYNKINDLEKEKEKYKSQINELNNNIKGLKEELEDAKNNKNENHNEVMTNVMGNLENLIRNTNDSNTKNDLFKLYRYMNDRINNNMEVSNQKPPTIKSFSNPNLNESNKNKSNANKIFNDDNNKNNNNKTTSQNKNVNYNIMGNSPKKQNPSTIKIIKQTMSPQKSNNINQGVNERLKNKNYINKFINTNK